VSQSSRRRSIPSPREALIDVMDDEGKRARAPSAHLIVRLRVLRGAVQAERRRERERELRPDVELVDVHVDVDRELGLELRAAPEPGHLVEFLPVRIFVDHLEDVVEDRRSRDRGRHLARALCETITTRCGPRRNPEPRSEGRRGGGAARLSFSGNE